MATKLIVEWTTGPNVTGIYHGKETKIFSNNEDIDVYYWETKLLKKAQLNLCWSSPLKRVQTVLCEASS